MLNTFYGFLSCCFGFAGTDRKVTIKVLWSSYLQSIRSVIAFLLVYKVMRFGGVFDSREKRLLSTTIMNVLVVLLPRSVSVVQPIVGGSLVVTQIPHALWWSMNLMRMKIWSPSCFKQMTLRNMIIPLTGQK